MRLWLVVFLFFIVAPAAAHVSPTSRVHNIRHVMVEVYGPDVCGDTMAVPIIRKPIHPYWGLAIFYDEDGDGVPPFKDCAIWLGPAATSGGTRVLCRLLGHEFGHLAGLVHSDDPSSIMYPRLLVRWKPCEIFRPNRLTTRW